MVKHLTPEEVWAKELEVIRNSGRQLLPDEEEFVKMGHWMSYMTDKVVTGWLKQLDNRWYPSLTPHEPTWPRCTGGISRFLELNPPAQREGVGEGLRPYVFVDGNKCELINEPTPTSVPWSGVWGLHWETDEPRKEFNIRTEWFRYPDALGKVHGRGKMYEWPTGDEASYGQIHGCEVAAIIRYAIKHGSFSGPIIGDDSFYIVGSWFKMPEGWRYSEAKPAWLVFKKYNFRVTINVIPTDSKSETVTDDERAMVEKVARFVEAEIIAYSLFGLEKFTVLLMLNSEDFCLPAGRIGAGSYLVPVGYVIERITGRRPVYDANLRQMRMKVEGREEIVRGELIEAANKYFPIPEDERLVANWETIQSLLGLQKVQDIRFEQ